MMNIKDKIPTETEKKLALEEVWRRIEEDARQNSLKHLNAPSASCYRVLIAVCAQHPLRDGMYPNAEFTMRLEEALLRGRLLADKGANVFYYVPGGVHGNDRRSLSEAGTDWLIEHGVPVSSIYGADANRMFAPNGVFNATDECMVATKIFEETNMRELHVVCSAGQFERVLACYLYMGVYPFMHSISFIAERPPHHSFAFEAISDKGANRFFNDTFEEVDEAARTEHRKKEG